MDPDEIQRALESLPADRQRALAKQLTKNASGKERAARVAHAREVAAARAEVRMRARMEEAKTFFFKSAGFRWSLASLLLFVIGEALLFHAGWYNQYLEPNSSAGQVEGHMSWLKRYKHDAASEVLVIGDSRIAEGFSARAAAHRASTETSRPFRFWNFGIGGSTPRVWYYMLRDADPTRRRFAAIVIPLDRYTDEDRADAEIDRVNDLNYLAGRLRWTDCPEFALSMHRTDFKSRAFAGCLFRGIPLRSDVQDLLRNISARVMRTKQFRRDGMIFVDDYGGQPQNLDGLTADFEHRTLDFPAGLTDLRKQTVQAMVMLAITPQTGEWIKYRSHWFGKILDLYKDSPTRIVFLALPRGPIPQPPNGRPENFPVWVRARSSAVVIPSATFRYLEQPSLYFDGLHLNHDGRGLFTETLTQQVIAILGREG